MLRRLEGVSEAQAEREPSAEILSDRSESKDLGSEPLCGRPNPQAKS